MKIVFIDNSTIVLDTLKLLVAEIIDSKMIDCEFLSDSNEVKKMIESETIEYDLLFLETNLCDVTGYEIAISAKKTNKYKDKPIVAITTEYTKEAQEIGEKAGIQAWLIKSIVQDNLQQSLNEIIENTYAEVH